MRLPLEFNALVTPNADRVAFHLTAIVSVTILLLASTHLLLASQSPKPRSAAIPVRFTDVRKEAGITFQQDATQTDEKLYLETMGTGVAWLDYDQDGLMDLYFVQSGPTEFYKPDQPLRSALYHNNGDGTFTDVTKKAGVGDGGNWSTSAAWIDYDKDGYLDLVVANYIEWSPK